MPYREDIQKSPRGVRPLHAMVAAVALIGETAIADEAFEWSADVAASSSLIDRGEQIGAETLEFGAGIATSISGFELYGSVYRLMPVGSDQDAFEDEVDYSVGVIFQNDSVLANLSANWLAYPGEGTEASLELVGLLDFDAPPAPRLIGFHDARFGDWGLEALVQPSWETGGGRIMRSAGSDSSNLVTGLPIAPMLASNLARPDR
jgi:hypothetical protein